MATEGKIVKPSFEKSGEQAVVLRSDFDPEATEVIINTHQRTVINYKEQKKHGRERTDRRFDARDPRNIAEVVGAMGADNPEVWSRFRDRIKSEYPSAAYYSQLADIQQRMAEQLVSGGPGTLKRLRDLQEEYKGYGAAFGLAGTEGLAACFDLFSRPGNEHQVFYPDPMLDALYKLDFVAYNPEQEQYLMMQVKTYDSLLASHLIHTLEHVSQRRQELGSMLQSDGARRDEEMKKLSSDLSILQQLCRALEGRYREQFTPLFLALPSHRSPAHEVYFDPKTGLPKKDFLAIVLPAATERGKEKVKTL